MKHIHYYIIACLMACFIASCVDDEPLAENRYANKSEMVSSYLANRSETYSDFITVLQRSGLWNLMATYGKYTCLAPTNDAMQTYLHEMGLRSLDELTDAECDTLARTHLIKAAYYITDLSEGAFPKTNMNDRYLTLSCDSDMTNGGNLVYLVNARCKMIHYDDSVENGVVHTLDRVLTSTGKLAVDVIKGDSLLSLFTAALVETHLSDSLTKTYDENYSVSPDSVNVVKGSKHHRTFGNNDVYWQYPETRKFMYTIFAEPDEVYNARGIYTLDDLKAYAKKVYDATYPEDAGRYDDDPTHRKNPLNRFVAYHILDRYADYGELTISNSNVRAQFKTELQDIMAFYETMCPYTILKVCDAAGDKWVNRAGVGARFKVRGCRIKSPTEAGHETDALNGVYHYIDDILVYDKSRTIDQVLNCRMRIDATTLSPDFMNAGARNIDPTPFDFLMTGFKPGFTKNFIFSDDTFFGVHNRFWCNSWENDMCACLDNFDIKFRIPPVPAGQTYEVRLGYVCGANRTVVQIYFDDNLTGDIPCDIPVDLRIYAPEYGFKLDSECANEEDIEAVDKTMRNNGFMKGPGAFVPGYGGNTGETMRDNGNRNTLRRILTTRYLEPEHNYYIRLRQVLENNAEMSLDYIEIVPKSIYDGVVAEDRY